MRKVAKAHQRIKAGNFHIPSPQEITDAMTPAGSWTAAQLAEWGVKWPPQRGWRRDLELRWQESQGFEPRDILSLREVAYMEEIARLHKEIEQLKQAARKVTAST